MKISPLKSGTFLLAVIAFAFCGVGEASGAKKSKAPSSPRFEHVVLIGSDGFSSEIMRLHPGAFPNIQKLFVRGTHTYQARSVLPSSSAVNWASMLMSAGPEMHGFTDWGSQTPELRPIYKGGYGMFPGIFGELRDQRPDAISGVIYSWSGIGYLFEKAAVNFNGEIEEGNDNKVAEEACKFIAEQRPTLAFVYFSAPDHEGHTYGWESDEYFKACLKIDSLVGTMVECIDNTFGYGNAAIIFASDHGGKGKGHGGKTMEEMETPFVMVGNGIPPVTELSHVAMKFDVAATIADMLGLTAPDQWIGRSLLRP